jgi:hypothetical protein
LIFYTACEGKRSEQTQPHLIYVLLPIRDAGKLTAHNVTSFLCDATYGCLGYKQAILVLQEISSYVLEDFFPHPNYNRKFSEDANS